jgi:UDP-2-acetamido-2,6-beta-L-arabino-hexul-4-ose reductase
VPLERRADERGSLFEAVRSLNAGQTFFSTTQPQITRGNHYHTRKVERFLVVKGQAVIRMRRLFSDEVLEYPVTGDEPCYVDMPTLYTHNITNIGDGELMTLFWANEIFDSGDADTFFEVV